MQEERRHKALHDVSLDNKTVSLTSIYISVPYDFFNIRIIPTGAEYVFKQSKTRKPTRN
jgi:hypothetical protein